MTEREAIFPKPFGYVRDNYGAGHIFQHTPFNERERLLCSTETVYSHGQMREAIAASRQQALEEAAKKCEEEVFDGWDCAAAIRSLTSPIGDKA